MKMRLSILALLFCATHVFAQTPDRQFIRTDAKVIALAVLELTGTA